MTLATRKPIATLDAADDGCPTLRRALGPLNLTTLGIGSVIGTGIFVTALLRRAAAAPGGEPSPEPRSGSGESWSIPRSGRSRATAEPRAS